MPRSGGSDPSFGTSFQSYLTSLRLSSVLLSVDGENISTFLMGLEED